MKAAGRAVALACALALGGCSYFGWFVDEAKKLGLTLLPERPRATSQLSRG